MAGIRAPAPLWLTPSPPASPSWTTAPPKAAPNPPLRPSARFPASSALYQLHYSEEAGPGNPPEKFLANLHGPDTGYGIEVIASPGGSFSVRNDRTGSTADYNLR